MQERPRRAMWLLNHSTARKFEIPRLRANGFEEIFAPKRLVQNVIFRSASVDWSLDENLTIPREDLEAMNAVDWYGNIDPAIWPIVNRHFDLMFFIFVKPDQFRGIINNFKGSIIWRVYGREYAQSYSSVLAHYFNGAEEAMLARLKGRFWLGEAYEHLHEVEDPVLRDKALFLPLGMADANPVNDWTGTREKVFFVCPDIGVADYYRRIYDQFKKDFGHFPHAIGGSQPVAVKDPNVLGFVTKSEHDANMREMRVMYYHSRERNHIHYHPFEAIRSGMPLVYMSGGILDRFGGDKLPGRCETTAQAVAKIKRILEGDTKLIEAIRSSQTLLLEPMRVEQCAPAWTHGLARVMDELSIRRGVQPPPAIVARRARKKIAVILPLAYGGGTFRSAQLTAKAVRDGAAANGETVDVVFGYPDDPMYGDEDMFSDLPHDIERRPFHIRKMFSAQAIDAMRMAGASLSKVNDWYLLLDDGMTSFGDCAAWLVISDRLEGPLLPLRPYSMVVYDYIQKYMSLGTFGDAPYLDAAIRARRVVVTTDQTRADAVEYAGIPAASVVKATMPVPLMKPREVLPVPRTGDNYFIWTTNLGPHKNHANAIAALRSYYLEHGGSLNCIVTGVGTNEIPQTEAEHLLPVKDALANTPILRRKVKLMGNLPDMHYQALLANARFLWHPAVIDNGTLSVVEAAQFGRPSLSSDYRAMREIDREFDLGLHWHDPRKPEAMAKALIALDRRTAADPRYGPDETSFHDAIAQRDLGDAYWRAVKACL